MRWNEQKVNEKPKKEEKKERKMPTPGKGEYDSKNLGDVPVWKR